MPKKKHIFISFSSCLFYSYCSSEFCSLNVTASLQFQFEIRKIMGCLMLKHVVYTVTTVLQNITFKDLPDNTVFVKL
jgi:hypothetical protein